MIEKRIRVVNGMTGKETPVKITDRATAAEVLGQFNLDGSLYALSRVRDRHVFPDKQRLASEVRDGETILAFSRIEVGGQT